MRSAKMKEAKIQPRSFRALTAIGLILALAASGAEARKKKKGKKKKSSGKAAQRQLAAPKAERPPKAVRDARSHLLAYATQQAREALAPLMEDTDPTVATTRGRILAQEKDYEAAAGELRAAADRAATDPEPLVYLGETLLEEGAMEPARRAFGRAEARAEALLAGDPGDADALFYLGVAQQRQQRYAEAAATFEKARTADPGNARILYRLGVTRAFQERWQEAHDRLSEAIAKNSGIAYAYYYRGLAAGRLGRKDLLINDLDRFLAMAPHAPEANKARKIRGAS